MNFATLLNDVCHVLHGVEIEPWLQLLQMETSQRTLEFQVKQFQYWHPAGKIAWKQ